MRGLEQTVFPYIARADLARDLVEDTAERWRAQGYTARVFARVLKACGIATEVYVVVITGRRKK